METLKSGCSPRVRAPTPQQSDLTLRYPCACTHQAHSHTSRPCPHCPSTPTAHLPEAFDAQWTTRTLPTSLPFVRLYIHFLVLPLAACPLCRQQREAPVDRTCLSGFPGVHTAWQSRGFGKGGNVCPWFFYSPALLPIIHEGVSTSGASLVSEGSRPHKGKWACWGC